MSIQPRIHTGAVTALGKKEWERIHGVRLGEVNNGFRGFGWRWQPEHCGCEPAHYLDTGRRTKRGLT